MDSRVSYWVKENRALRKGKPLRSSFRLIIRNKWLISGFLIDFIDGLSIINVVMKMLNIHAKMTIN